MEFFKDGKYIIGFLVGVICSFVIVGGIKNYQNINEAKLSDGEIAGENQIINEENKSEQIDSNYSNNGDVSQTITRSEDPHSPELQRLALILRETEKMIERLKKDMRSVEIKQQTANLLNLNQ